LSGNLDAALEVTSSSGTDNAQSIVPVTVYDSLGKEYEINIEFKKISASGGITTWQWNVKGNDLTSSGSGTIQFNSDGKIVKPTGQDKVESTITLIPPDNTGSKQFNIKLDFTNITMFAGSENYVNTESVDGYSSGNLTYYTIGSDGIIMGVYSNGKQQPLGLIGLAVFDNPAGLQRIGNNLYISTSNSGDFQKAVKPGSKNAGVLNAGVLEMSNVDLAEEFTEMIITQRGFQANSRILTTADEMLQELVNIKR
jgi:flagellar hook protein FlgE